jgi:hypothetical protein
MKDASAALAGAGGTVTVSRTRGPAPQTRCLPGKAVQLHATVIVVASGCLAAGGFELSRALSGHGFSWVYVFEWPFFAGFSVVIWWRLLHNDDPAAPEPLPELLRGTWVLPTPALVLPTPVLDGDAVADEQLRAWQDYLARRYAERPPGAPPQARGPR